MTTWWQFAMVAVGGGTMAAIVNGLLLRRKIGAETESVTVTTATALLDQMRQEVQRLLERVREAEDAADIASTAARAASHDADEAQRASRRCAERHRDALARIRVLEAAIVAAGGVVPGRHSAVRDGADDGV